MDAERVMQVFDNLLSNAARFAQSRVEASLAWNGSTLVLSVRDDGPGFTPGRAPGAAPSPSTAVTAPTTRDIWVWA